MYLDRLHLLPLAKLNVVICILNPKDLQQPRRPELGKQDGRGEKKRSTSVKVWENWLK